MLQPHQMIVCNMSQHPHSCVSLLQVCVLVAEDLFPGANVCQTHPCLQRRLLIMPHMLSMPMFAGMPALAALPASARRTLVLP
jgi:hypothetical protein